MRVKGLLLVWLLIWCACSDRERANPFDPLNPTTHGAPTGLKLIGNRDSIRIEWEPVDVDDLSEYIVYGSSNSLPLQAWARVGSALNHYLFTGCTYDEWYRFGVQAITKYDAGTLSDTVAIMPGPANLLVADYWEATLRRISYDGNQVYAICRVDAPTGLAVDTNTGRIYLTSYWSKRLLILKRDFTIETTIDLAGQPLNLVYDYRRHQVLVLEREPAGITVYTQQGTYAYSCSLTANLTLDASLSLDSVNEIVWLGIPAEQKVIALDWTTAQRKIIYAGNFQITGHLAAANGTATCWIPTDTGVVYLELSDSRRTYRRDCSVKALNVENSNGDCYFTGYASQTGWLVGKIEAQTGHTTLLFTDDYPRLYGIQVVTGPKGTGFWVVQTGSWSLLRFDAQYQLLGKLPEFSGRLKFCLE